MSRGIDQSITFLNNLIEGIVPKRDIYNNFVSNVLGDGGIEDIDNMGGQRRVFEISLDSLSEDDGMAGISGRKRIQCTLKVRYDIGRDKAYLDVMMSEDSSYLINALKGPDYNFNITGIVSLILKNATISTITNIEGIDLAYIINLPFDLLLMED